MKIIKKGVLIMPQNYIPELRLFVYMKKVTLTKESLLSMEYRKLASLRGVSNSVKNVKKKPLQIQMYQTKWNL